MFSIGNQPNPWIRPIWEALFEGLSQLTQAADDFWRGVQITTPGLVLRFERLIHKLASRLISDVLVGHGIQLALESEALEVAANQLVQQREHSRLQKAETEVRVRMLGGTQQTFVVPYYLIRAPRGPGRPSDKRGPNGNGYYPKLELLGIHDRVTPAVASNVASQVARSPVEEATAILQDGGLELNSKTVTRISRRLASRALEFAGELIGRMRSGRKGTACRGLRIAIAIDGGRVRTRNPYGRRRRSTGRRRFKGEWREPKVFVIYELDENGRRKKKGLCIYGGTMGQADECFELLAAYLCYVGAHLAEEVVILGDGAEWIWNRVDDLVKKVAINRSKVTEVVDFYHVVERLHEIAKTQLAWTDRERQLWVTARVAQLKAGHVQAMMRAADEINAELSNYFHNNRTRLDYKGCRNSHLPIGSGAVESGIRRIINLRLKGNGSFWDIKNAEGIIHLRCQLVAGRWTKLMESVILPKEHWGQCAA